VVHELVSADAQDLAELAAARVRRRDAHQDRFAAELAADSRTDW
jgi:hypothetical protein